MAVFISVMPFPKNRVESVGNVAGVSLHPGSDPHWNSHISCETHVEQTSTSMLAALTAVFTHHPLPSAWGI